MPLACRWYRARIAGKDKYVHDSYGTEFLRRVLSIIVHLILHWEVRSNVYITCTEHLFTSPCVLTLQVVN